MDKQKKWKNVDNEEERNNYIRLKNELEKATDNSKKEYLDSLCDDIIRISKNRTLLFNVHKYKGTRLER
jgi:ribosomal protein S7